MRVPGTDLAVYLSLIAAPDERDEYGRSTVRLGRNESQGRETSDK